MGAVKRYSAPPWAHEAGVSGRQLSDWARAGWLLPAVGADGRREWPAAEQQIASDMARLVRGGLEPWAAAKVARFQPERAAIVALLLGQVGEVGNTMVVVGDWMVMAAQCPPRG